MMLWNYIILGLLAICFAQIFFLRDRNLVILLMVLDLIYLCISLLFAAYYYDNYNLLSNCDAIFAAIAILVVSVAETALILALMARLHKKSGSIVIRSPADYVRERRKIAKN